MEFPKHFESNEKELKQFSVEAVKRLSQEFASSLAELTKAEVVNSFGELRIIVDPEQKNQFELGKQTIENTSFSVKQFIAALCAAEKILPQYMQIVEKERFEGEPDSIDKILNLEQAKTDQILSGLKILDLGCGQRPFFSYVTRMLGATVYTADIIPAGNFEPIAYGSQVDPDSEQFHIQYDLNKDDAEEAIRQKSGGGFNFVTEAHLDTSTSRVVDGEHADMSTNKGGTLAKKLLIEEGIYYNGETRSLKHTSEL